MPTTSAEMITALQSNIGWIIPIWKIISRDGVVAPYMAHSRPCAGRGFNPVVPFTFGGVTYRAAPVQPTRTMEKIGLAPNSTQVLGVFDDLITQVDVESGRWKLAKIVHEHVNYMDLSMGSTSRMVGVAGNWEPLGPTYQVEFLSNASLLSQLIGDMTSSTDRNAFPAGLDKATWTVARNVVSSADRRHLVIDGTAKPNGWFENGVIVWATGANMHSPGMEIKSNIGNTIELYLPMPADIMGTTPGPADQVALLAGYDGTRTQARDKFSDAINMAAEPDLPGLRQLLSYPE